MKFWNFAKNEESGEAELYFKGTIDDEVWWGDEITPDMFRDELSAHPGDLSVYINSPGGNCIAASEIYTILKNHKGKITVKIDALAASAASVIAMAGDTVEMAPCALMMIHDPSTMAMGNKDDFESAISVLEEVKESIINAYEAKTGLSRAKIAKMMSEETWMNAKKAKSLGFADVIMFADGADSTAPEDVLFSSKLTGNKVYNLIKKREEKLNGKKDTTGKMTVADALARLQQLAH